MLHIMLFPPLNCLYFYISTFSSIFAVPNKTVFCSSLISCFPLCSSGILRIISRQFQLPLLLLLLLLLLYRREALKVAPQVMQLITDLSPQRTRFDPMSEHVTFVLIRRASGQSLRPFKLSNAVPDFVELWIEKVQPNPVITTSAYTAPRL